MVALACSDPMTDPRASGIPTAMAYSGRQLSIQLNRRLQARSCVKSSRSSTNPRQRLLTFGHVTWCIREDSVEPMLVQVSLRRYERAVPVQASGSENFALT